MSLFSALHPSINNPEKTEKTVCETVCLYPYPDKKSHRRAAVVFVLLLAASAFFIVRLWELAMYDNTAKARAVRSIHAKCLGRRTHRLCLR